MNEQINQLTQVMVSMMLLSFGVKGMTPTFAQREKGAIEATALMAQLKACKDDISELRAHIGSLKQQLDSLSRNIDGYVSPNEKSAIDSFLVLIPSIDNASAELLSVINEAIDRGLLTQRRLALVDIDTMVDKYEAGMLRAAREWEKAVYNFRMSIPKAVRNYRTSLLALRVGK